MLAQSDPKIWSTICEVLESNPDVAALNSLSQQFSSLIINPINCAIGNTIKIYRVIVIDALDECSLSSIVKSLIKAILNGVANISLKFIILSWPENWIRGPFVTLLELPSKNLLFMTSLKPMCNVISKCTSDRPCLGSWRLAAFPTMILPGPLTMSSRLCLSGLMAYSFTLQLPYVISALEMSEET